MCVCVSGYAYRYRSRYIHHHCARGISNRRHGNLPPCRPGNELIALLNHTCVCGWVNVCVCVSGYAYRYRSRYIHHHCARGISNRRHGNFPPCRAVMN